MQEKIKIQNGFIQIPLLIAIIVSIIGVSVATTGVVLYKQGKLTPLIASISQTFKGAGGAQPKIKSEEPQPQVEQSLSKEINQEENSQTEQALKQARLEAEKAKQEAERLKREAREQRQREITKQQELERQQQFEEQKQREIQQSLSYKTSILDLVKFIKKDYESFSEYNEKVLQLLNHRIDSLEDIMSKSSVLFINNQSISTDVREIAEIFNELHKIDLRMTKSSQSIFEKNEEFFENQIKILNDYYNQLVISGEIITQEQYVNVLTTLKDKYFITPEFSDIFFKFINQTVDYIEDTNQNYKDALTLVQNQYYSSYYRIPQNYRVEFYDFSSPYDSIMNDYYRQEQIRALNNISDQLYNIWHELAY